MASTIGKILSVRWLHTNLDIHSTKLTILFCDNQDVRHIANHPNFHDQTKNVWDEFSDVCERVESQ